MAFDALRAKVRGLRRNLRALPAEEETLAQRGYREYVGGLWDEIGQLQFDFLRTQGLVPEKVLLDVACGSLRGGRLFIPYLEPGNYLGIDKNAELIEVGKAKEIAPDVLQTRRPEFVISDSFEFERFSRRPDYSLAQSLFTHLHQRDIKLCLRKLSAFARPGCRFFATFFETSAALPQIASSHSHRGFYYTRAQMERFGRDHGWEPQYLGEWNHPRNQMMIEYVKR